MVLFFDHGMHLTAQIWKRCSKQTDKFFERRSATDRRTGARPKELDVVRQNLVRDFESSLAHYLVGIELNERLALLLNNPVLLFEMGHIRRQQLFRVCRPDLQRAGERLPRAVPICRTEPSDPSPVANCSFEHTARIQPSCEIAR